MKPHIRLKLKPGMEPISVPYWQEVIEQQEGRPSIHSSVDEILHHYSIQVWVTHEYRPARNYWDNTERRIGLDRVYRLISQTESPISRDAIAKLAQVPIVESAELGVIGEVALPPVTPKRMSGMTDWRSRQAIQLGAAHQFTRGDPSITVAILDTGLDLNHPEYVSVLKPGYDFVNIIDGAGQFVGDHLGYDTDPEDEVGHGTHVAGIIAAQGLSMPVGVVPHCRLLPVRVLGAMRRGDRRVGAGLVDNINSGIKWAIDQGADVINMSLGIRHTGGGLPHADVVEYAKQKDVTIVAATGNDGQSQLYYPGALPYVIAVGAVDSSGAIAEFSTYGPQVDIVAPGTDIYSTYLEDGYAFSTGTSHASPFVAGAIALLKSYALQQWGIRLGDRHVKYLLKHTADKLDPRFKHRKAGFGRLNLLDALQLLEHKLIPAVS